MNLSRLLIAALPFALATLAIAGTDVPLAPFHAVSLRGGGHVVLIHGDRQRVTLIKGSTQYTTFTVEHGSLKIDACNWNCPHEYDLEIEIVTPQITALAVAGGGDVDSKSGFPQQGSMSVAVNGGGDVDIRSIPIADVSAVVNGGGDLSVHAVNKLSGVVNGGGDITYWGNPQISSVIHGGGDISRGS